MIRKIFSLLMVLVMVFALVACGNDTNTYNPNNDETQNSQSSTTDITNGSENNVDNTSLSQTLTFMGYKIKYPEGVALSNSDYGQTFRYNSEIAVLIEAPSVAGVMLGVDSLDSVVTSCEEYIVKTFENTVRELFSFGTTTQSVTESQEKTINGIEMLRVEGTFVNTAKSTTISYVGYYFLLDSDPVYIVGIPMTDNVSVDTLIDQIANSVTK